MHGPIRPTSSPEPLPTNRIVYRLILLLTTVMAALPHDLPASPKKRILVVSSYHREYLWSQETHRGVSAALLELGYLDHPDQVTTYTRTDTVESSQAVVQKVWMNTKNKSDPSELAVTTRRILEQAQQFQPDLLLLGDDNAVRHIGSHYLDTPVPVVFWGINIWPLKYGLLDSLEKPGHNVTGVYQPGYMQDGLELLTRLVPGIQTLAILSDDSETSLAKVKDLHRKAEQGALPVRIVGTVVTNHESEWKKGALALASQADAIFLANHHTIKDAEGLPVDPLALGAWYLRHIRKPDIGDAKQFVQEGVLCTADDSGYRQGYEAVRIAHRILAQGADPAHMPPVAPPRGARIVNRERAHMLGIAPEILTSPWIDEIIEQAEAFQHHPESP
ncbi:MAG: hypothetical protein HQL99_05275 [Magnetococcales bacterium]|nr:hypothetical protein [Magnetococcales bacterium]